MCVRDERDGVCAHEERQFPVPFSCERTEKRNWSLLVVLYIVVARSVDYMLIFRFPQMLHGVMPMYPRPLETNFNAIS